MAAKSPINIIAGAGNIGDSKIDKTVRYDTPDQVNAYLDAFCRRGYQQIDTPRNYSTGAAGISEPRLGAVEAGERFIIDTKVKPREPGSHKREKIAENFETSLQELKINQINIEYLHQPDRAIPFEETYIVAQVLEICGRRGFVKPSVYQGQYNPLVRGGEKELFPLLRKNKHGVLCLEGGEPEQYDSCYTNSPAGGGFFAGNYKTGKEGGRFDKPTFLGRFYSALYLRPSIETATENALAVASNHGISGHAAALRWTLYHSALNTKYRDSIIIGASSINQANSNLDIAETGPLPDDVAEAFDALHEELGADEIRYAFLKMGKWGHVDRGLTFWLLIGNLATPV